MNITAMVAASLLFTAVVLLYSSAKGNENNLAMQRCLKDHGYSVDKFDTFDFSKAAGCYQDWRFTKNREESAELSDFLKHNPRYRYPGQSNNRCFGKPRENPFESAYLERDGDGFRAGVKYKDTMPAGCYENAPWDNRDKLKEKVDER